MSDFFPDSTETSTTEIEDTTSWDRLSFPRVLDEPQKTMTIDCPDKTCWLEYRVVPICHMYISNAHTNCDIPCNLANCTVEIKHFFDCPIWTCNGKLTTLPPNPTSTLSPLPPAHSGSNLGLYFSIAGNILFGMFIAFGIWKVWQIKRNRAIQSERLSSDVESGILRSRDGSLPHFSLTDPSEVQPLLSGRGQSPAPQSPTETSQATNLLQRLRNFRYSFHTHRWVETQPESSDSRSPDLTPSAPPNLPNGIANDAVELN